MAASVIDEIKGNKITVLHLSQVPKDYFGDGGPGEFIKAMRANTSIKKVIFDKHFLACTTTRDRADIVSSVGQLPNVESVILADSLLRVGVCVANLVRDAKSLKELSMEKCLLQGIPKDFEIFEKALNENKTIVALHIHECTAPNESVDLATFHKKLKKGLAIDVSGGGARTST